MSVQVRRLLVMVVLGASAPRADAVEVGQILDEVSLKVLEGGGTAPLVERSSSATVAIFFRPGQDRSTDTLKTVGTCGDPLSRKGVRTVGVVSGETPPEEIRQTLAAAGATLPVLLDAGDALYARAGIRMHPAILILDRARKITGFEPYHQVDFCAIIGARVRRALGELDDAALAKAMAPADSKLPGADPLGVAMRHVSFGRKLLKGGASVAAHENAQKSLAISPTAAAWVLEGDAFVAEGKCPDARRAYDSALQLDAQDAAALAGKSRCPP